MSFWCGYGCCGSIYDALEYGCYYCMGRDAVVFECARKSILSWFAYRCCGNRMRSTMDVIALWFCNADETPPKRCLVWLCRSQCAQAAAARPTHMAARVVKPIRTSSWSAQKRLKISTSTNTCEKCSAPTPRTVHMSKKCHALHCFVALGNALGRAFTRLWEVQRGLPFELHFIGA